MLIFISGGVRSGKSALGELLATRLARGRKVYLATAQAYDGEMEWRIRMHQAARAGKGFATIERSRAIDTVVAELRPDDTVLLDCLGTLAANEMFGGAFVSASAGPLDALFDSVLRGIMAVHSAVATLIVVSNDVFSDGIPYELMTAEFVSLLGRLHCALAAAADAAVECACGCHIIHKGQWIQDFTG